MISLIPFIDVILHIDKYLATLVDQFGVWTYIILFIIIFCETGLVITPFLPGDSLIFTIGALAALNHLNIFMLYGILLLAAILGDSVNYFAGSYFGLRLFKHENRLLKKEYVFKTERFYEKHGAKTILLARFIPIIRTFAPFVAGVANMKYAKFIVYNITGAIAWITLFLWGGYFFGNTPIIKENFSLVIWIIIGLSLVPVVYEYIQHRKSRFP